MVLRRHGGRVRAIIQALAPGFLPRRRIRALPTFSALVGLALALLHSTDGRAGSGHPGERGSELASDEPPDARYELAPRWRYGAQIELDVERTRDFDLDSGEDDDELSADPKFQLSLEYRSGDWRCGLDLCRAGALGLSAYRHEDGRYDSRIDRQPTVTANQCGQHGAIRVDDANSFRP